MSSDTIRLIAEFFAACVVCAVVPGSAEILSVLRHCGRLRLDLLQTDPSVYDGAGLDLFCNRARHHSVAQLRGIQALPGDGLSDRRNLSAGAGKRHLLDRLLRGDKRSGAGRRKRVSDIQRCGGDRARHSPRLRIPAELVP